MDDFQNLSQEIYLLDDSSEDIIILEDVNDIHKPSLNIGMKVFALKDKQKCIWKSAVIKSIINFKVPKEEFQVEFLNDDENNDSNIIDEYESNTDETIDNNEKKAKKIYNLDTTCIAFSLNSFKILPIRTRVVSLYSVYIQESTSKTSNKLLESKHLCSAVIAEKPTKKNLNRYLLFFDNGYVAYVSQCDIYPIVDSLTLPVERLSPDHIYFIRDYFEKYPKRVTVSLEPNSLVDVYLNKRWIELRVLEVDCLLVKFEFNKKIFLNLNQQNNSNNNNNNRLKLKTHNVWFYRGSFRLLPLFEELLNKLKDSKLNQFDIFLNEKFNLKYIDTFNVLTMSSTYIPHRLPLVNQQQQGSIECITISNQSLSKYEPHECSSNCCKTSSNSSNNNNNPLLIPILNNWQRQMCFSTKKSIAYIAPCGRRLRSIDECYSYLIKTESNLTIDMFTYDTLIDVTREFKSNFKILNDLTYNSQNKTPPIPVVNCLDFKQPEKFNYTTKRINLLSNEDENYSTNETESCCDCIDNCNDKLKCSCWQKTFKFNSFASNDSLLLLDTNIGYKYKRLRKTVHSGIFECNSRCKCNSNACLNRVVQENNHSVRLELFKTLDKGWAVRCLDDLAKGTFIATYTGDLITEQESLSRLQKYGDTYFAELNFLNNLKKIKLYNSRLTPPQSTDSDCSSRKRKLNGDSDHTLNVLDSSEVEEEEDIEDYNFKRRKNEKNQLIDTNILNDSEIYVIDAKLNGNITRFINHSCSPNTFIQHVFTETNNLKYPQIALFTLNTIKAGTELTWDYNYQVGSIKGRQLYCCCNSNNCRGRLI